MRIWKIEKPNWLLPSGRQEYSSDNSGTRLLLFPIIQKQLRPTAHVHTKPKKRPSSTVPNHFVPVQKSRSDSLQQRVIPTTKRTSPPHPLLHCIYRNLPRPMPAAPHGKYTVIPACQTACGHTASGCSWQSALYFLFETTPSFLTLPSAKTNSEAPATGALLQ